MQYYKLLLVLVLFSVNIQAQKIKNFTLSSVTGNTTFRLRKAKGKFIALHFLLKTECPYCIRHTSEYFERANELPNVVQVFIKPDNEQEIKAWASKLKYTDSKSFTIYQDLNAQLADRFNIPSGYQFHGQFVHYPALVLLDEKGKEVFRYIGKNNGDRFSFEKLKSKIQEIKSIN